MNSTMIRIVRQDAEGKKSIVSFDGGNRYAGNPMYGAVQQMREAVENIRREGGKVLEAYKYVGGIRQPIKAESVQEATDRENWETCKCIAEEVEAYAEGRIYKCPECGAVHDLTDFDGDSYKCPECETVHDPFYLEQLGIRDYMEDVLDIEYRVSGRMELRSVQIMVACGGPNIYIDTGSKAVELYWWADRACYPLDYDACAKVDAWAEELFECR